MNNEEKKLLLNFVIIICFGVAFSFAGAGMAVSYIDGVANTMCNISKMCISAQPIIFTLSLMATICLIVTTIFFGLGTMIYFKKKEFYEERDDLDSDKTLKEFCKDKERN